jgi:hypothetical protein
MPPPAVKTIRDLIFYRYAKLIAKQAGLRENYGFIMNRFNALKEGRISWSNLTREHKRAVLRGSSCAYCNSPTGTNFDHVIPISKGGPDSADNLISVCRECNLSKADRDLYYWWVKVKRKDSDDIPRVVEGKYLKLIYDIHKSRGTLESTDLDGDGDLTVLDLGFILGKRSQIDGGIAKSEEKMGLDEKSTAYSSNNRQHIASIRRNTLIKGGRKKSRKGRSRAKTVRYEKGLVYKIKKRLGIN